MQISPYHHVLPHYFRELLEATSFSIELNRLVAGCQGVLCLSPKRVHMLVWAGVHLETQKSGFMI